MGKPTYTCLSLPSGSTEASLKTLWKSLLAPAPPGPLVQISLPPDLFCPPSLNVPNLAESYNAFNHILMILNKIQYSNNPAAVENTNLPDQSVAFLVMEPNL